MTAIIIKTYFHITSFRIPKMESIELSLGFHNFGYTFEWRGQYVFNHILNVNFNRYIDHWSNDAVHLNFLNLRCWCRMDKMNCISLTFFLLGALISCLGQFIWIHKQRNIISSVPHKQLNYLFFFLCCVFFSSMLIF